MLTKYTEILFGCRHGNYSFPITLKPGRSRPIAVRTGTYVVCLDCGRELPYDWSRMKVVAEGRRGSPPELAWEQPSGVSALLRSAAK
jgi:hypothetical protein